MKLFALLLAAVSLNMSSVAFADHHEGKKCEHCEKDGGATDHKKHDHEGHGKADIHHNGDAAGGAEKPAPKMNKKK